MKINKILVIDDEKNIRLTLDSYLSSQGYEVVTAVNGEDGLQKLEEDQFPIILLDMKLPGMDGIEVLKRINQLDYETKVIMITGYGSVETAVETMKRGAVDYLRKPFKPEEIGNIIDEVKQRFELEESSQQVEDFNQMVNLAKASINKQNMEQARELLNKAVSRDSQKPEPFNLLGVIHELNNNIPEAMKMYRAALALDPTYKPARQNMERASQFDREIDDVNLGDED